MRQLTSSSTQNQQPLAGPSTNYPGSSSKKKKKNRKKETSTTPPRGDKGSGASPLPPNSSTLLSRWTQKVTGIASSCGVSLSSTGASLSSEDQLHDKYDVDMMSISSPDPNGSGSNKKPPRRATNSQPQQQPATAPHSTDVTAPTTTFATNVTATHNNNAGNTDPNGMVDHATLATATTASATTWCDSADDYDAVVEENEGMEVVMSSSAAAQGSDLVMMMATSAAVAEEKTARTSTSSRKATSATITSVPQQPKSFRVPRPQDPPYQTHSFSAGKHVFTVDQRYSMIRMIGSGAYGVVISATDAVQHSNVAIKMIPKAFQDEIDAKRILREIKLLKHFQHHDNICNILDMMPPNVEWLEDFTNVYMVTELMETDLHRIIYSKQKLSIDHVQYFVYQILRGLLYIHSCEVLHRDLKPSNLLVNSNCDLKICDFGLARGIGRGSLPDEHNTMLLTEYVVTRWYRAPEIMLACHEYSYPIDVWSVGCIFGELILRKPLFPGDDYIDQLTIICEKLGKVPEADLDFVTSEKAKRFMRKLPNKVPTHLSLVFPGTPLEALDAMRKMLEIHPSHRLTVPDALRHPFFEPLHNPLDEPVSSRVFDFGFESEKLHRLRLKELIWEEVGDFRPSCLPVAPSKLSQQRRGGGMMEEDTAAKKDP